MVTQQAAPGSRQRNYVDKGYRRHNAPNKGRVFQFGQKRGINGIIKRELKCRSAVELIIGQMKASQRLNRNHLKEKQENRINAILAAAGYNFKHFAKRLKALMLRIKFQLSEQIKT